MMWWRKQKEWDSSYDKGKEILADALRLRDEFGRPFRVEKKKTSIYVPNDCKEVCILMNDLSEIDNYEIRNMHSDTLEEFEFVNRQKVIEHLFDNRNKTNTLAVTARFKQKGE